MKYVICKEPVIVERSCRSPNCKCKNFKIKIPYPEAPLFIQLVSNGAKPSHSTDTLKCTVPIIIHITVSASSLVHAFLNCNLLCLKMQVVMQHLFIYTYIDTIVS
jgi:hypothetical protein